jgi:transcription antitermination factor NusG
VATALTNKEFDVFLPLYSTVRKWKDRMKELRLPLFPSYVFVRDFMARRPEMLATPGVHSMLMIGRQPADISDAEIEVLRRAVDNADTLKPHPFLVCGDRVRIKSGPLQGIEGILSRRKNLYRLIISVELLAKSAALEVDTATIEPVISHSHSLRVAG